MKGWHKTKVFDILMFMSVITDDIKNRIEQLGRAHRLSLVVLFGSQASGKVYKQSDVDIAFLAERPLGPREIGELALAFSRALGMNDVDLLDLKTAPPLLLKQIAIGSRLLYESEPSLFARFKIYGLKRYMEARSLLKLREASLEKFLQTP